MIVFAIPSASAERCAACLPLWKERGYRTAVLLNGPAEHAHVKADYVFREFAYRGWGASVNWLAAQLDFDWLVTGGDDMRPPPFEAQAIAQECLTHFGCTMGVMQGCGDRWLNNAENICGSPWIGRDFAHRWNQGNGPFWPGYHHHYADNELHDTAQRHGLLWNRYDLTVYHDHFRRSGQKMPDYMKAAYARNGDDKRLYHQRRANGFPLHEPVP